MVVLRIKNYGAPHPLMNLDHSTLNSLRGLKALKIGSESVKILSNDNSINSNSIPLLAWKILSYQDSFEKNYPFFLKKQVVLLKWKRM